MAHLLEAATSGRSKCRGCGSTIARGEMRFGERLPNPFADEGEMTLWFHVPCAAYKRPASLAEVIAALADGSDYREVLAMGLRHHRLVRINGLERAPSGRARCRDCRELIAKDSWRVPLVFFEEGMFNPGGNVHIGCAEHYFETREILDRLVHFSDCSAAEIDEVRGLLQPD